MDYINEKELYVFVEEKLSSYHAQTIWRQWGKFINQKVKEANWQIKKLNAEEDMDKRHRIAEKMYNVINENKYIARVLNAYLYEQSPILRELVKLRKMEEVE